MNKKIILVSILVFFLDFISKIIVTNFLEYNQSIKIINNFFYINYVQNQGAAWSIMSGKVLLLIIVSIILIGIIIYYLCKNKNMSMVKIIGFSLLLGGALGNLVDRLWYGYVIDFLSFNIFHYNFPVFNLADCAVVLGSLIILLKKN